MNEAAVSARRWMKHREKQGVWHLATKPELMGGKYEEIATNSPWVTACRGDMLYGTMGPILQQFEELPKGVKCVRCTKLWLESSGDSKISCP